MPAVVPANGRFSLTVRLGGALLQGPPGPPGVGVPPGGTTGQALTKLSDRDYDTGWRTPIGGSGGGADYVIEQGSNDVWTWRKWASGIAELWGIFSTNTLAVTNAWHNVYYGTWMGLAANKAGRKYPFDFVSAPAVTATPYSKTSADFWLLTDNANNVGTELTHAPAYACVLPTSATITDPQIHYHVIGKYK